MIKMKNENKVTLGASVKIETRERYKKLLKESGFKADMFINIMLDLYEDSKKDQNGGEDRD